MPLRHRDDHPVEYLRGAPHEIDVAVRHRVKRPRVERYLSLHRSPTSFRYRKYETVVWPKRRALTSSREPPSFAKTGFPCSMTSMRQSAASGRRHDVDDPLRGGLRRVRRIGEDHVEKDGPRGGALDVSKGVSDPNLRDRGSETASLEIRAERLETPMILLDEYGPRGPPAQGLDPDGARAGEEIEDRSAFDVESDRVEDRSLDELLRRPEERPVAAAQIDALLRTCDDSHGNLARSAVR